jgi:hypothetical protein
MWTKFVGGSVSYAQKADALATSHPIEVEVANAGQITEIFDAISYYKGSSVIRMLADYLGGTHRQQRNTKIQNFSHLLLSLTPPLFLVCVDRGHLPGRSAHVFAPIPIQLCLYRGPVGALLSRLGQGCAPHDGVWCCVRACLYVRLRSCARYTGQ